MTLREARQRHEDAEEALADIRAARKLAEDQRRVLEDRLAIASLRLREDVAAVFKADPGVRAMCERFAELLKEFVDMRRALSFLHSKGALPDECESLLNEYAWPELPGERPFAEAFAALERSLLMRSCRNEYNIFDYNHSGRRRAKCWRTKREHQHVV